MVWIRYMGGHIDLPYLHCVTSRGKEYVYFRAKGMPRKRLDPQSPSFLKDYEDLRREVEARDDTVEISPSSIKWLINEFKASEEWYHLAENTRRQYTIHLSPLESAWGTFPYGQLSRKWVKQLRAKFKETPAKANMIVASISALYAWAIDNEFVQINPASRIKALPSGTGGYQPWEEEDIEAFRDTWPIGTVERAAMELFLGSMIRGCDAVRVQRQHLTGGRLRIRQKKTKGWIDVPLPNDSWEAVQAFLSGHNHMSALITNSGKPPTEQALRSLMRRAMDKAGLEHRNTHGLRVTGAVRLYELGWDEEDIKPFTGHRSAARAAEYARKRRKTAIVVDSVNAATGRTKGVGCKTIGSPSVKHSGSDGKT